jgi:hypothetical protein
VDTPDFTHTSTIENRVTNVVGMRFLFPSTKLYHLNHPPTHNLCTIRSFFLPSFLSLQFGLLRRHSRAHHVPDITRRLVKEERHALAAEVLADDVELHAVLVDHVCDSVKR